MLWDTQTREQYIVSHYDHIDSMDWSNIWWATRPRDHYVVSHSDHMDSMDWYNIWRGTLTIWIAWIDAICGKALDHVSIVVRHSDNMDSMDGYNIWWGTLTLRTYGQYGHYGLIQYMVRHSTTWAIYCEPPWPHGHDGLIQYMVIHSITWTT